MAILPRIMIRTNQRKGFAIECSRQATQEDAAVGIGQGSPEPCIGPELAGSAKDFLVQRGADDNIEHYGLNKTADTG